MTPIAIPKCSECGWSKLPAIRGASVVSECPNPGCSQHRPMQFNAMALLISFPELFSVCPNQMLYQLHWQNPNNFAETELVGQGGGFNSVEECERWLNDLFSRRQLECPQGWVPLVCDEISPYFVRAAAPTTT